MTGYRHGKNSSVICGAAGGVPEGVWIFNFSNLERMYYNLVVHCAP
jgi:hypothetical protein